MKTVKVNLNKVRKTIKKVEELLQKAPKSPNALQVHDIYLPLNHLFNQASKWAFEHPVKTMVVPRKVRYIATTDTTVYDHVKFFGASAVGERKIFDAAQKVANTVNFYADRGYVTGVLTKLILLQLVTEPHQLERWVICSYVALSAEGIEYLEKNPSKVEFPLGGVPENVEDL